MATYSTWRLRTFASITVVIQVKLSRNVLVQTFSFANDRTLFQNALSTLLTSLGVSQGQQAPGSQAKSLKLCLCLSPPLDCMFPEGRVRDSFSYMLHVLQSSCSITKSCLTLCDPMDCSPLDFPVLHHLTEFAQTHVR